VKRADERGSALVTVVLVGVVLAVIGATLLRGSIAELDLAAGSHTVNRSLQAAEAGINDYIAKLTQDHLYYAHWLHPAEATRQYSGALAWTYPERDRWRALGDGLEYDLQIGPPTAARATVRIVATGREVDDPGSARTVEAFVRTASVADFQMLANADVVYGSSATTNGKIYAGNGSNIAHAGGADHINANLYAEGHIYQSASAVDDAQGRTWSTPGWIPTFGNWTGVPTYSNGATGYDASTIRTVIKTPIDFDNFTGSITDVQAAAAGGGLELATLAAGEAWRLDFRADGMIDVQRCSGVDLTDKASTTAPPCTLSTTEAVPANGAVYADADVIVSGTVNGRVTVASTHDVVVGGDITYASTGFDVQATNSDVLGLMAADEVLVPRWAPGTLTWRAATLAMARRWRSATTETTPNTTMTFYGSTAANKGGYMNQYATRKYNYDPSLLYLQPPYFPVLEDAYTIVLQREIR
jgi:hypothetical protein